LVHGGDIVTIKQRTSRGQFSGIADASYALCAKVGSAIGIDDLARDAAALLGHRKSRTAAASS
jgi:hypothetical protein